MNRVFALAIIAVAVILPFPVPAQQTGGSPPSSSSPPPADPASRKAQRLDMLFERLREAPDAEGAKGIATEIERHFERSGSATADLVFTRAKEAMSAKEFDLALDLLDYVVALEPGWAEPYHRRAIVHFVRKDADAALRDVRETLAREPRHYHALAGLGGLFAALGNSKAAYRAFVRALDVYPLFPDLKARVEKMRVDAEGQPI